MEIDILFPGLFHIYQLERNRSEMRSLILLFGTIWSELKSAIQHLVASYFPL